MRGANGASGPGLRNARDDVAEVTAASEAENAPTEAFVSIFVGRKAMAVM